MTFWPKEGDRWPGLSVEMEREKGGHEDRSIVDSPSETTSG